MALSRGFSPAQFRDAFLGTVGNTVVNVAVPSISAGATAHITGVAVPGVAVNDIVFVQPVTPVPGLILDAQPTAAGTIEVNAVATAAFSSATVPCYLLALRPKTA
jgi:hypothetical protein